MILKVPERERREFKYKPRYYQPDKLQQSAEKNEEAALRNRIEEAYHRESNHKRIPASRLWVFVAFLLLVLLLMSRLGS